MKKISALADIGALADFIAGRLNSDGGYSFARPLFGYEFPSSISETYYALATLSLIGKEIPERERTLAYLHSTQKENGAYTSPGIAFHAAKSLALLGKKPQGKEYIERLRTVIHRQRETFQEFDSTWFSADYDAGDSPFRPFFCAARVLKMADAKLEKPDFIWLAYKEAKGGGFGVGKPDIASTYHALSSLFCVGFGPGDFPDCADFIEKCGVREGGFAPVPGGAPAFAETTYLAIAALHLLGRKPPMAKEHALFISRLQHGNGGFARSSAGGISMLCNCYYAVKALSLMVIHNDKKKTG